MNKGMVAREVLTGDLPYVDSCVHRGCRPVEGGGEVFLRRRMKNEGLRVKDYYLVSLIDTTMEAKQYVDGGETIRR
jgi:hypothetical protein